MVLTCCGGLTRSRQQLVVLQCLHELWLADIVCGLHMVLCWEALHELLQA